ncbi:kielin chordin [Labeo rohita]|uniref:Kielin chordin n=1 Tax=Labeo rohita TaxID=84645 RepID=A0A498P575_LABRO|nr:kielin chordin [Labeo rohita]
MVGLQNKGSEATLISFTSSAEGPLLELVSNTKADWLQLEFRSPDGNRNEVLKVPGGSPFTGRGWVRMALSVEPRQVVLYVDCQDVVVLKLKEGGRILSLDFPQDLQVTFSSTAGKKSSKFNDVNTRNSQVRCDPVHCQPTTCPTSYRRPGECCPTCSACSVDGRPYNGSYSTVDGCQTCTCQAGNQACVDVQQCPQTCQDGVRPPFGSCCRDCSRCNFEGQVILDGVSVQPSRDPCKRCVCNSGNIVCDTESCPKLPCNLVETEGRQCCPRCRSCVQDSVRHLHGSQWKLSNDPCTTCTCTEGQVQCESERCDIHCRNPASPPLGSCCSVCDGCSVNGIDIPNRMTLPQGSPCDPTCTCEVRCEECRYEGEVYVDGQVFTSKQDPRLRSCEYEGSVYENGQEFRPPGGGPCIQCSCQDGHTRCASASCPQQTCGNAYTPPGDCCPQCPVNPCEYDNRVIAHGDTFPNPSNPCEDCVCSEGNVNCGNRECPRPNCNNPRPGTCCQNNCNEWKCVMHTRVLSRGTLQATCASSRRVLSHVLRPESDGTEVPPPPEILEDPSIYRDGAQLCDRRECPQQCTHPGDTTGCCPVCDRCLFEGQIYGNTQTFYAPSDPCKRCVCQSGSISCSPVTCPTVSCHNPITLPGQCCPQCKGCIYDGVEHLEGSTWFASSSPCMSCMCVNGVTTCSKVHCLSTCVNQISVPGECCPVCADCVYNGRVYSPGESFHPSDNPCEICTCEVMPDGGQHMRCYRKQCPSLVDCPKHNIQYSESDSCCPVCAQPLSNCTATLIGNEVLATDDPCFTCQCKDLTWTCIHRGCPPLSCPPADQHTPPDSCCPICDECVLEGDQTRVPNGRRWTDKENECVTCICNQGHIKCDLQECPPLECPDGSIKVKNTEKCCPECTAIISVFYAKEAHEHCVYDKQRYNHNDHWEVDECTSCSCVYGDVHCQTQRCPSLTCASDETPVQVPGMCCPHCIPHPATCVVFGDPHYRTFDGKMVNFQGTCTYVLARDCEGGDFSVHVSNEDRGRKGVSWTKEVTVLIGDTVVQLLQDWIVKVDYEPVSLPFLKEPYVYLERKTNTILLNTNVGLKVLWNGRSHLEVSVPGTYKKKMCGLCGNFNNYSQDDMKLRNGQITTSEAVFGNNWKVGSGNSSLQCPDVKNINPCNKAGYSARKTANARCAVLKSPVFKRCHKLVPPEMFYASCVYDLCACGSNMDECLCEVLEAYTSECREAGVILQWRSPTLCAVGCPLDRGYVFDECGPPCPKTCFNKDVPLGVIEAHCFKPCVPGCQCPAGLVEHNAHCIAPEKCPKIILENLRKTRKFHQTSRGINSVNLDI